MAFDLVKGKQDGRDWSIGALVHPPSTEKPGKKFGGGLGWVLVLGIGIFFVASRKERW